MWWSRQKKRDLQPDKDRVPGYTVMSLHSVGFRAPPYLSGTLSRGPVTTRVRTPTSPPSSPTGEGRGRCFVTGENKFVSRFGKPPSSLLGTSSDRPPVPPTSTWETERGTCKRQKGKPKRKTKIHEEVQDRDVREISRLSSHLGWDEDQG